MTAWKTDYTLNIIMEKCVIKMSNCQTCCELTSQMSWSLCLWQVKLKRLDSGVRSDRLELFCFFFNV